MMLLFAENEVMRLSSELEGGNRVVQGVVSVEVTVEKGELMHMHRKAGD